MGRRRTRPVSGATLDTGALIAFVRNDRRVVALIRRAEESGDVLAVPAGVVAQAWRNGRRQARLARLLGSDTCVVVALDDRTARLAGLLCALSQTADVVDASVVVCARDRRHRVVTSDPSDIRRLDPSLDVVPV